MPVIRMPCITSGVAKRSVTRRFAGTMRHWGRKANWIATMRLVMARLLPMWHKGHAQDASEMSGHFQGVWSLVLEEHK